MYVLYVPLAIKILLFFFYYNKRKFVHSGNLKNPIAINSEINQTKNNSFEIGVYLVCLSKF